MNKKLFFKYRLKLDQDDKFQSIIEIISDEIGSKDQKWVTEYASVQCSFLRKELVWRNICKKLITNDTDLKVGTVFFFLSYNNRY